ncbi:MAG: hypothetical protein J5744_04445 [Oscillospiraceae bacterium]|nr:hypothetical protein [Oscillospiraceae bacterium]
MQKRESFLEGFRRCWWLLLLPVIFFSAAAAFFFNGREGYPDRCASFVTDIEAVAVSRGSGDSSAARSGGGIEIALSEPVSRDYFNDALFLGDSITSGLTIYDMFEGFNAIYKVGVNPMSAAYSDFTTTSSGRDLTLSEAVKYYSPRKLYIMLGTNGIDWATTDELLEGYRELILTLKTENPDCLIIVQSIPPVSLWVAEDDPSFSKDNFDRFNHGLKQMCIDTGIYFLDINAAFTTPDGYLSQDYAAPDGIHFGYDGYQKWYDYLMCHTVHGSSVFSIGESGYLVFNA